MTGWIRYETATLAANKYLDAVAPPVVRRESEAVIEVPEPATAHRVVEIDGVITFESQPAVVARRKLITHAAAMSRADQALSDFAAGDAAKLRKLLARLIILTRDRQ